MRIRTSFVSNSSSSSFVILKSNLTDDQIIQIKSHIEHFKEEILPNLSEDEAKWLYWEDRDKWRIMEDNLSIYGDTYMDNFDMDFFLTKIGVSREDVEYYE